MKAHIIFSDDDPYRILATVHPARQEAIDRVLNDPNPDGRSPWMWVRLANGDLILGTFPYAETYEAVEDDSRYPE